jgi:hypothetical protein
MSVFILWQTPQRANTGGDRTQPACAKDRGKVPVAEVIS